MEVFYRLIGIYRIYYKETGKSYIGQSINIPSRIFTHFHAQTIREAKSLLAADMKEYGKEAFAWEVLERCDEEIIDCRESYWIDALDPIAPKGYNLKSGGKTGRMAKKERERTKHSHLQLSLF